RRARAPDDAGPLRRGRPAPAQLRRSSLLRRVPPRLPERARHRKLRRAAADLPSLFEGRRRTQPPGDPGLFREDVTRRNPRSRRRSTRVLLSASLLLSAAIGDSATASPPVPRISVEEVLRQSARVRWDASGGAKADHHLQRRTRGADSSWGDWADVAPGMESDLGDHWIDAGPGGSGLPPGVYAYRLRAGGTSGWSDWSE